MKLKIIIFLAVCSIISGCDSADTKTFSTAPPISPPPTQIAIPTATDMAQLTEAPPKASEPITNCKFGSAFLAKLKTELPLEEAVIYHNVLHGVPTLGIWFVDPDIAVDISSGEKMEENKALAINGGLRAAFMLKQIDPCVNSFFIINSIVVDSRYNSWFSATIQVEKIPDTLTDNTLEDMYPQANVFYLREDLPTPIGSAPPDSCDWPTTLAKIQQHFSPNLTNTSFYYSRDEEGNYVWANYYVPSQETAYQITISILLNIASELDCLYPAPDKIIVTALDPEHQVILLGFLPNTKSEIDSSVNGFDINNLKVQFIDAE
jgi:hypothetical protein